MKATESLKRGECIGLDAEFTGSNEMLELAVLDLSLEPLFESLFTPARSRRWSKVPHGITPAMVKGKPKFAWRVPRVQRIIDRCRYMVGFALENDIAHLRAERVARLETKRVLDLRDWFWLIYGRHHGFDYREGVGLTVICDELQVTADTNGPHRAGYDTECTLRCFLMLMERFVERQDLQEAEFDEVVARFDSEFDTAMAEYRRAAAAGFLSLVVNDEGTVMIKANKERPAECIESVAVADRHEALTALGRRLTGRHRTGRIILPAVTPEVITELRRCSCS
ncbi:MAG: hypothetical protein HDS92_06415 [Bacteroidales bacterium]|nr:hypothetical protein [Bacteroidales bacterium]